MYKKFVASFMTALMAAMTLVSPALGATALNTYPTFLGKVGDFYVVVGAKAAASDITGAIDIAANLAQLSYKETTTTGTTSTGLTGTERKISIPTTAAGGAVGGTTANNLPTTLRNFHYSGLKDGRFEFKGTKHNYHEDVWLRTVDPAFKVTHSLSNPVNGTLKMRVDTNATTLRYVFDDSIATADFSSTSANSTTYSDPLKATVGGREFQIVSIPSTTSFVALVGTVKTLSDGESVTVGDLTFKVTQSFSSSTAKIEITDPSGNVVKTGINTGSTESVSYGGASYNYRVLSSGATASGVPGYGQVLAGKGDIEKTFDGSDQATVTEFGSDWKIGGTFATQGRVTTADYIYVSYQPASLTDATRYFTAGSTFKGPAGYFEMKYAGYTPDKFAKVTVQPTSSVTIYDSTLATGYRTVSGLSGLKISSDVAGTIVWGSTGYNEAYLLFNASAAANAFGGQAAHWLAYKDTATNRVVTLDNTTYPVGSSTQQGGSLMTITGAGTTWSFTLSYGGPGAQVTYRLNGTFNGTDSANIFNANISSSNAIREVGLTFQNKSIPSTSSAPELRLGSANTADAADVSSLVETTVQSVGDQVGSLITDNGVQVYTVKSNSESDKVIIGIPPETVFGLVQFGKIGETTAAAGTTIKEVVAVTTAVAKLDSEVTSTDETGKHLVLIGGSCANTLVQKLVTAGKIDAKYTCAGGVVGAGWEAKTGYIWVLDGAFATGKQVVVAAGTTRDETRLVSSVLQQYATKLSGITGSSVKVTGASVAAAVVTAA